MSDTTKITLQVPDAVLAAYETRAAALTPKRKVETMLLATIKDAAAIDFSRRPLIISPEGRRDLEAIYETTVEDEQDLLTLVKKLVAVEMEGVEIILTEHEASKLADYASFHGETVSDFATRVLHDAVRQAIGEW